VLGATAQERTEALVLKKSYFSMLHPISGDGKAKQSIAIHFQRKVFWMVVDR